jgi:hypothetical protein
MLTLNFAEVQNFKTVLFQECLHVFLDIIPTAFFAHELQSKVCRKPQIWISGERWLHENAQKENHNHEQRTHHFSVRSLDEGYGLKKAGHTFGSIRSLTT